MTTEAVAFYGAVIDPKDSSWKNLVKQHDIDELGPDPMLLELFHPEFLDDPQICNTLRGLGPVGYLLARKMPREKVFEGCHIAMYGDRTRRESGPKRYYVAVTETEMMGRGREAMKAELMDAARRPEWDDRLRKFSERIGIRIPGGHWMLTFWSC